VEDSIVGYRAPESQVPWSDRYKDYYKDPEWKLAIQIKNQPYLLHWIMASSPHSVLEVGAGSGKACALVKRLLPKTRVVATDVDPVVCEGIVKFMEVAQVDVEVERQDVLHLPYEDLSFDVCFSEGVMEHFSMEEIGLGLVEQLRVSKIILVSVPLIHWFLRGFRGAGGEIAMAKAMWILLLQRAGMILDLSFLGDPLEEVTMLAALSNCPGTRLRISDLDAIERTPSGLALATWSQEEKR